MKLAKEFVKFVVKELGIQSMPRNIKFVGNDYSSQHLTFGTYNPSTDEIIVCKGNRHPVDVLRTLAHELVHHKQREDGKELNGEDGSDTENEANAIAGTLMRKFRTIHPNIFEIFNVGPWGFHTNMEETTSSKMRTILSVAKTNKPQMVDEQYIDGYTAKLLVATLNNLHPNNRERFCNESIDMMVAIAYKMTVREHNG
jgi:hypothetical protein